MKEDSASILSDEQSLELDCRMFIPKFQQKDYDTYYTENSTSVYKRIMEIKSNSSEYKFKIPQKTMPLSMQCMRKFSEELPNNQLNNKISDGLCKQYFQHFSTTDKNNGKKKEKSTSLYSLMSNSPIEIQKLQTQLIETTSKKSKKSLSKSPKQQKSRRKLSNTSDMSGKKSKDSPIKKQPNQMVYYCVDSFKDPIQLNRIDQSLNIYTGMQRSNNLLLSQPQPKSILKSKSCCSESSNGECSSKYKSMKSSIFKRVTFESMKQSMKQSKHNQLVIIQ